MKIVFFLSSRYPTHKAYGVTTGETARALRESNNEVKIYAPEQSKFAKDLDSYGNEVFFLSFPGLKLTRGKASDLPFLGPLFFTLSSISLTLKLMGILRRERPNILWLRDYWSALLVKVFMPYIAIVLEVHHLPRFSGNLALTFLAKKKKFALLAIRESLVVTLKKQLPKVRIFLGPMGASKDFFAVGRTRLENFSDKSEKNVRVCYLGRMTSSGKDNGIIQLIEDWREVPAELGSLTLIGVSQFEIEAITRKDWPENLFFEPSIDHSRVPLTLAKFDCGLVPYPEGRYHQSRFPIKLVEYCAIGLNVLAADTPSNRELLGSNFCYFYEAGNPASLKSALMRIREEIEESKARAIKGFLWAENYTYSKRLTEIYPFLEGCIK